jgi:small-conductance mechanosensitive channel
MPVDENLPLIAHAIQLSIAPVFLLTGIAGLLGVMATRLARVIDRARTLEERWPDMDEHGRALAVLEVDILERRRHLASWSINFCTGAALLVCLVIVTLFVEELFSTNLKWLAGGLFVCVMLALVGGLFSFLREVYLATRSIRIDARRFHSGPRA